MSDTSLAFQSSFTLQSGMQPSFPALFEQQVHDRCVAGLYRIVLMTESAGRARVPIDELNFEEVETREQEPNADLEELVPLLVARMDEHNKEVKRAIKYALKFHYRKKGPPEVKWVYLIRDFVKQQQEENDGMPPLDLGSVDPERLALAHYAGAFSEMRMVVTEGREDHKEFRTTISGLLAHIDQQNNKIIELATKHLEHSDAQARINQAGWDALQEGIELNKNYLTERHTLTSQLSASQIELAVLKEGLKKAGKQELIDQLLPAAAIAAGRAMENSNPMVSGLLQSFGFSKAGIQIPGLNVPTEAPQPATNGSAAMPAIDIKEICSALELQRKPLVCLGRMLGATMVPSQMTQLQGILSPNEWEATKMIFGSAEDAQVSQGGMVLFGGLALDDARRGKMMNALTAFQQNIIGQLIDRVGGKVSGPLDPTGLSTKPSDQARVVEQTLAEKARLEAEAAKKDEEIIRLRKLLEEQKKPTPEA